MPSHPRLGSRLWLSLKFTYREITTIVVVSVGFWLAALALLPIGGGIIGLLRTVRTIPDNKRTEYESLEYFFSTLRTNFRRGVSLSIALLAIGAITLTYLLLFISTQSIGFFIGGLLGIYLTLYIIFLSYRISSLIAHGDARTVRDAWGHISTGRFSLDVLYIVLLVVFILISVLLPVVLVLVLPGFLAVFEATIYETTDGTGFSRYQRHLDSMP